MKIITNNVPRPIIEGYELTDEERWNDFDYYNWKNIENGNDSMPQFVRYKGELYDLSEFVPTHGLSPDNPLRKWNGYRSDSFFSGLLIKWVEFSNHEEVIVGWYYA
jgi:hypothetical protein